MKRALTIGVGVVLLVSACFFYFYESDKSKTVPDDIRLEAVLKRNGNPRMEHKDYMLEVQIDNKGYSQHMIYPYIRGLQAMSFDTQEEDGFFVPTSIGGGAGDDEKVRKALSVFVRQDPSDSSAFIGFWSPQEAGSYRMRMYFQAEPGFTVPEDMHLVYIHKEEGFLGKDLGWTKLVKIKAE